MNITNKNTTTICYENDAWPQVS